MAYGLAVAQSTRSATFSLQSKAAIDIVEGRARFDAADSMPGQLNAEVH